MIFVTVGTHEQQFDRLVEYVDQLKGSGVIEEDVFIQTGFSTYKPLYCDWKNIIPYGDMVNFVNNARIIITHGGPSSFIMPLQIGKIPIVVPRQLDFEEHVNNHQVDFCNEVAKRNGNIIVIENVHDLKDVLVNYDNLINSMTLNMQSNNERFNIKLKNIIDDMFHKF